MNSKRLVIFLLIGLIIGLGDASAQDSWLGGTGYWSNGSYWSLGFPPPSTDNATISIGGSFVTLDLGNTTVYSLTLSDSELTDGGTSQTLTVTNGLNLSGLLYLYGNQSNGNGSTLNLGGSSTADGTFEGNVTLNNYGVFTIDRVFFADGTLNNYGTLITNSGDMDFDTLNNMSGADWENNGYLLGGTVNNNTGGTLNNQGYLAVHTINNAGLLNLNKSSELDSDGLLNNTGTLNNFSAFNRIYGTVNNVGTLNNYNSFDDEGTLNNAGTLNNYSSFDAEGTLNNAGTLNNGSGALLSSNDPVNNSGMLNNNSGGTFFSYNVQLQNSGTLNNYGTLANGGTLNNTGTINNYDGGTFNANTLNNTGTINNYNGGTLSAGVNGGPLNNTGTLYNYGFLYNFYSISLNNTGTLTNYGDLSNSGTLNNFGTLSNFSNIYNYDAISNAGKFVIAAGAIFANNASMDLGTTGTYTQTAGSTVVDGLFSSVTPIQISGGTLSGSGLVAGDVMMGGTISPGDSPGRLTILGNYTQLSSGTFFAELAGLTPGTQYDQLVVSGLATLDGTLDVVLLNGFLVQLGDSFVLMTFADEAGRFSILDLPTLPSGEYWALSYNPFDLTLTDRPVPDPPSLLLLGSGLIAAVGAFRRKINL